MARFPCDACQRLFRGGAKYLYPALVNGVDAQRERLRVCPVCAADLGERLGHEFPQADLYGGFSRVDVMECVVDSGDTGGEGYAFFITAYFDPEVRSDFYGRVCREHGERGPLAVLASIWPPAGWRNGPEAEK